MREEKKPFFYRREEKHFISTEEKRQNLISTEKNANKPKPLQGLED